MTPGGDNPPSQQATIVHSWLQGSSRGRTYRFQDPNGFRHNQTVAYRCERT